MRKGAVRTTLGAVITLLMTGCGAGTGAPARCSQDPPATCSGPSASYAAEVAPLLMRRCRACHTAGGVEETAPFDDYGQVWMRRVEIEARVGSCLMPPADQPQPTSAERASLLGWLACGAQNN